MWTMAAENLKFRPPKDARLFARLSISDSNLHFSQCTILHTGNFFILDENPYPILWRKNVLEWEEKGKTRKLKEKEKGKSLVTKVKYCR